MSKSFTPLTSKPTKYDKYIYLYNNANNKGKSWCINGKPVDKTCNVLCNCVGWACGRFNHIYNILTGYSGIKYPKFCCNAENFIEVAKAYGLEVGTTPKPGAIMVWQKGTLVSSDGAGHVAIVEKVNSSTQVMTSESGYGNFDFKNKTRNKGDGNWGSSSPYKFRGFIYNPAVEYTETTDSSSNVKEDTTTKPNTVARDTTKNQIYVSGISLRVRNKASLSGKVLCYASKGYYNFTSTVFADNYKWYEIAADCWIAFDESWATLYYANQKLNIGDVVTMMPNAPIYGKTSKFASWVYKSDLYVRSINGNRVIVSIVRTGPITGSVERKYLIKK